tara:strand:- start:471 stop:1145 length:675 start_codon:yes stop_codon:yes gene_type:complete
MHSEEKIKPTPIWPIWVFGLIVILFGFNSESQYGGMATGIFFWFTIFYAISIHKKNKLYFGKDYKKNPKPTKEAIEKFKKNKWGLSGLQKIIVNVLAIGGLIIGFLFAGIIGAVLMGIGLGALSLSICLFINKEKISKIIGIFLLGLVLTGFGIWISYFFLVYSLEVITNDNLDKCETWCSNSQLDIDRYTQYSVEFDKTTNSFVCHCLTDDEEILAQTNFPIK